MSRHAEDPDEQASTLLRYVEEPDGRVEPQETLLTPEDFLDPKVGDTWCQGRPEPPEAATACSPGRQPRVLENRMVQPRQGRQQEGKSAAPPGLGSVGAPTRGRRAYGALTPGYMLSPPPAA